MRSAVCSRLVAGDLAGDVEKLPAEHLGPHRATTPVQVGWRRRDPGRTRAPCRRPRPGRDRRAGSRPRRRSRAGHRTSRGRGGAARTRRARSGGRAGCADESMMSSCISAQACTNSSAAQTRSTGGRGRLAAGAEPAEPRERRSHPFAAAQHELFQLVDDGRVRGPDRVDDRPTGGEELLERDRRRRRGTPRDRSARGRSLASRASPVALVSADSVRCPDGIGAQPSGRGNPPGGAGAAPRSPLCWSGDVRFPVPRRDRSHSRSRQRRLGVADAVDRVAAARRRRRRPDPVLGRVLPAA